MAVWSCIQKLQLEGALRLDAEYYQPKFLESQVKIRKFTIRQLKELANITDGSHEIRNYLETGILFLRSQDIFEIGLEIKEPAYISQEEDSILKRSKPKIGDILVTKTGNVGTSLVVDDIFPNCNLPADITRIRLKDKAFNSYFIATLLNSRIGRNLIEREMTGSGRPRIVLENIKVLEIPTLPLNYQEVIEKHIKNVYRQKRLADSIYYQAEDLLLDEVGFEKIIFNVKKSFIVNLSATKVNKRIDGEHFHTKFKNLREHLLKTKKAKSLKELRTFIKRGLQPEYVENGEIMVINSQHLGRTLLNIEDTERTDRKFFDQNKRSQLKNNDILFYSTGAHIGRTNIYLENKEAVASNHVAIIRTTKECNPIYLSVYLNSQLGLMQTDQWASGSAQREIYPDDIDKFLVYLPSYQFQQKIADLVQRSHESRKKAKELLREAKRKVEEMIQGELVS